jgi:hypothetical protein
MRTDESSGWRWAVCVLAAANAVAAAFGAVGLMTGWLSLEELTRRLPLASPLLGGVALALLVALPQAVVAFLAARRSSLAAAGSVLAGSAMVLWIAVEVAFLHVVAGLQVAYLVVGLVQVAGGFLLGRHDPGVGPASLAGMVLAVLADVPRFLLAPCRRSAHARWGCSDAEVAAPMAGDDVLGRADYRATRAVSIDATPESVWRWLVQVGADRAGWYSDDLLDHGGVPSAGALVEEWQHPAPGGRVAMSRRTPLPAGTFFTVDSFEEPRWLLWVKADSTWSWELHPEQGGTRLVTRVRARYDWSRPAAALVTVLLMELGDFPMMRRMLLGIRERAARTGSSGGVEDER